MISLLFLLSFFFKIITKYNFKLCLEIVYYCGTFCVLCSVLLNCVSNLGFVETKKTCFLLIDTSFKYIL